MKKVFKIDFYKNEIVLQDNIICFNIIKRSKKNLIIKFVEYNNITISVTKTTTKKNIEEVIFRNIENIVIENNKLKKINSANINEIFILGEKYNLHFDIRNSKNFLKIEEDKVIIYGKSEEEARKILYNYYFKLTEELVDGYIRHYADKIGVKVNKIYIKDVKTIWGSCSSKNNLTFNFKLGMFHKSATEYVVVHELAHLIHRNHSKEFWSLVEQYIPNWKEIRKIMKNQKYNIRII